MEQKIITSSSASGLNSKIAKMQLEGFEPLGEHKVLSVFTQHVSDGGGGMKHSIHENEYSQTMKKV